MTAELLTAAAGRANYWQLTSRIIGFQQPTVFNLWTKYSIKIPLNILCFWIKQPLTHCKVVRKIKKNKTAEPWYDLSLQSITLNGCVRSWVGRRSCALIMSPEFLTDISIIIRDNRHKKRLVLSLNSKRAQQLNIILKSPNLFPSWDILRMVRLDC